MIPAPEGLTLEMVLLNQTSPPFSLKDFSDYLKVTYCNENLLFYEAVADYKQRCIAYFNLNTNEQKPEPILLSDGIPFDFSNQSIHVLSTREKMWFETLKNKFEIILQDFILSDAEQEINIPYEIRHQLLQSYQTQQSYHPALLYPACSAVVELLRISAFIPFATDPHRYYCPIKKKKEIPMPIPEQSTSNNFLRRITTSLKFRYSSSSNTILDSPPMSPPRLSSWKQINIPDALLKDNNPTVEKTCIVTPSNIITSSSVSTSSCSTISSNISTTTKSRPTSR
jgi:hypothetical protein